MIQHTLDPHTNIQRYVHSNAARDDGKNASDDVDEAFDHSVVEGVAKFCGSKVPNTEAPRLHCDEQNAEDARKDVRAVDPREEAEKLQSATNKPQDPSSDNGVSVIWAERLRCLKYQAVRLVHNPVRPTSTNDKEL